MAESESEYVFGETQKAKLLVAGYTRNNFKTEVGFNILTLFFQWYFNDIDSWDMKKTNLVKIKVNTKMNSITGNNYTSTAVGSGIISSNTEYKIWKLKCLKKEYSKFKAEFVIGLIPSSYYIKNSANRLYYIGYGLDLNTGQLRSRDIGGKPMGRIDDFKTVQENDVINIRFTYSNGKYGELYFSLNDGEWKRGFPKVPMDKNQTYRFAVSLSYNECVQMLQ